MQVAAATTHVSAGGNVSRPKTSLGDGFKWRAGGVAEAVINPSEGQVWATAAISSARHERDEVGGDRLQAYCSMCRTHAVHLQAIGALVTEVNRWPLSWGKNSQHRRSPAGSSRGRSSNNKNPVVAKEMIRVFSVPANTTWATDKLRQSDTPPIPVWCTQLVYDAIESIAICGYFAYQIVKFGSFEGAVVVPPEKYVLRRTASDPEWKTDLAGIKLVLVHPPRHNGVRSSAATSMYDTARYSKLEDNITQRDSRNSRHTVYTSISADLRNQNGSTRQWFRSTMADEAAGARPEIDTDFKELIDRRSDMVRRLTEHTREERRNLQQLDSSTRLGVRSGEPTKKSKQGRSHHEHIITDGKEYVQCAPLQSLTDGKSELDRIYTNIMLAYNVPPQIFGKNVNTERHAASNRLTESAVQIYALYGNMLRNTCAALIGAITKDNMDDQFFIGFKPVLDQGVLGALAPALTPQYVTTSIADNYGVPTDAVVQDRVCEVVGGIYTGNPQAAATLDGPPKIEKHGAGPAKVNRKEAVD